MSGKTKAALIGCGMIADTHLTALLDAGAEVAGVFDLDTERASAFAAARGMKAYASLEELLSDDMELVSVCTPSGTHRDLAERILNSHKNAIVEKPMALTVSECLSILEAEERTGRFCAPISQLRFSDSYRRVRKARVAGEFGRMILASLSMKYYREPSYYAGSWRGTVKMDGGGALMNQGIHGIDVMIGIMGPPVSVTGHVATLFHDIEVEDAAAAALEFRDGALGVIDGSTAILQAKPRRLEICGTKASVTLSEDAVVSAEGIAMDTAPGTGRGSQKDPRAIGTELHERQFRNILKAVRGEEPLYYTSRDALLTVGVIGAIYESSRTGKAVRTAYLQTGGGDGI